MRSNCPVGHSTDPRSGQAVWTVFRREDVMAIARDTVTFSNGQRRRLSARRIPLESDPPEHTALRKVLMPFFSPATVLGLEPLVREIVDAALAPFIAAGGGDFAQTVCRQVPTQVLLERLGQSRGDWEQVKDWSEATTPMESRPPQALQRFEQADAALWAYSEGAVRSRAQQPRDPRTDPISALLAAEVGGQRIARDLVVGFVRLAVAAGHDSTSQAMGICAHYLATHPQLQQQVRASPALVAPVVDEILRLRSPVVAMPRIVTRDVTVRGCPMKAGDRVMLNWASANHDEDGFPQADTLDLTRQTRAHLAFGHGVHTCLGAALARQELRLCLEGLLAATREIRLEGPVRMMEMIHHGYMRLPLAIQA
jgi:cytochrome P450